MLLLELRETWILDALDSKLERLEVIFIRLFTSRFPTWTTKTF